MKTQKQKAELLAIATYPDKESENKLQAITDGMEIQALRSAFVLGHAECAEKASWHAMKFAEYISGLIVSNFQSNGHWSTGVNREIVSTEKLWKQYVELRFDKEEEAYYSELDRYKDMLDKNISMTNSLTPYPNS